MKTVLILEDKKQVINTLRTIVLNHEPTALVLAASNLRDAYVYAMDNNISLFLVDIVLNPDERHDTSGLDFVKNIRTISKYEFVPVIFITGLIDPELYAYRDLHCYGYLEKPILNVEADKCISAALRYEIAPPEDDSITLTQNKIIYNIRKRDIIYFYSKGNKLSIVTIDDTIKIFYMSCKRLMEKLDSGDFIWCNRSTIVNRDYIQKIDKDANEIVLIPPYGTVLIGIAMRKEVYKYFDD